MHERAEAPGHGPKFQDNHQRYERKRVVKIIQSMQVRRNCAALKGLKRCREGEGEGLNRWRTVPAD